jgi:hypothetical protein
VAFEIGFLALKSAKLHAKTNIPAEMIYYKIPKRKR